MKQEIGSLLHLYLNEIKAGAPVEAPQFLIVAAAQSLNTAGDRNWIPLVVKQTGADTYQVIANDFIFAAVQEAGLEKVWCLIADDAEATQTSAKLLAKEITPKINLATATRQEIKLGLDYLINRLANPLSGVKLPVALDKIDGAPRQYWSEALKEVTALKCGITAGKNLDIFEEVFYSNPVPPPRINLTNATREEIDLGLNYLNKRQDNPLGLSADRLTKALDRIDGAPRQYWSEALKEVPALKCGITAGKKLDIFKEVFYTTPAPIPVDTIDPTLLNTLTVAELKKLAQERGLKGTGKMRKEDWVNLLSQS